MPCVVIREDRCKGCGLCREACPRKILELARHFNEKGYHPVLCLDKNSCTGCAMCARTCPDVAITVYK